MCARTAPRSRSWTTATWGVFEAGWRDGFGADGDHLKTPADADVMVAAGYTFFTIDPGEHVDDAAHTATDGELTGKVDALPWADLESSPGDLRDRFLGRSFDIGDRHSPSTRKRWHAPPRNMAAPSPTPCACTATWRPSTATVRWEMELSVDETETPTSHREHLYIVTELRAAGRTLGQPGAALCRPLREGGRLHRRSRRSSTADLAGHAAIARALGPYKLSLHSGSDKFSVYPLALAGNRRHGASQDGRHQHIWRRCGPSPCPTRRSSASSTSSPSSAMRSTAPPITSPPSRPRAPARRLADGDLPAVLDQFDARQMLHVTFGSAIMHYGPAMQAALRAHEETHYAALERHFNRHLAPFARSTA